jgi:hypothetical protein
MCLYYIKNMEKMWSNLFFMDLCLSYLSLLDCFIRTQKLGGQLGLRPHIAF